MGEGQRCFLGGFKPIMGKVGGQPAGLLQGTGGGKERERRALKTNEDVKDRLDG